MSILAHPASPFYKNIIIKITMTGIVINNVIKQPHPDINLPDSSIKAPTFCAFPLLLL
ncbi:hypothetical protein LM7456_230058 [Listeria monocytogenes]|nr:hypothetical protein LM7456_230058 [Listeria monocytogenes]